MKLPSLFRSFDEALRAFWMLLFVTVCLAFAVVLLAVVVATRHERVVLTPPYVDKELAIGWSSANADYLKSVGLYFVTLAYSVTPSNVEFVKKAAGTVVDASIYPAVRKRFETTAAEPSFKAYGSVQRFEAGNLLYEPDTSKVFVSGELTGGGRTGAQSITYELRIVMRNGRPWITSVDTYDGLTPHTLKWLAEHPPEKKSEDLK